MELRERTEEPVVHRTMHKSPTVEQWGAYQNAFNHLNKELFGNALPQCMLNFSRHARSKGFFASERWQKSGECRHEISLNPDQLDRPLIEVMSTLCHEMCHLWRNDIGKPPSAGYHDKKWAQKMEEVGLLPTDSGEPGGKKVGRKVTHCILENGKFERAFRRMPEAYLLPWRSPFPDETNEEVSGSEEKKEKKSRQDKLKYSCPTCHTNCWGKDKISIYCGLCKEPFVLQ
jgi:SprT-like family